MKLKALFIIAWPSVFIMARALPAQEGLKSLSVVPFLKCPLHALTGLWCPTCGLTRATYLALVGQWGLSVDFHFLGAVFVLGASAFWLTLATGQEGIWHRLVTRAQRHKARRLALTFAFIIFSVWGFGRNFDPDSALNRELTTLIEATDTP